MLILIVGATFPTLTYTISNILLTTIQFKEPSTQNTFSNYWIDYLDIFCYSFCQKDNFIGMKTVTKMILDNKNKS